MMGDDKAGPTGEMEKVLDAMLSELSSEEIEQAARTSYVYFLAVTKEGYVDAPSVLEHLRRSKALAMARRCLVADKGKPDVALTRLRSTLVWRKEMDIDGMRTCFQEDDESHATMRSSLSHSMSTGLYSVRGYDREGRTVQSMTPARKVSDATPEEILAATVYHGERAIACTERRSKDAHEKYYVAFDYSGFKYEHAISLAAAKMVVFALRDHYCERVQAIYLLDAPMVFQMFWNIIKPFIDPDTKKKIKFITGEEEKKKEFGDLFDKEEAVSCILDDGHLVGSHDVYKYLHEVPFDFTSDEVILK